MSVRGPAAYMVTWCGMGANLPDQKMCRVFGDGLGMRLALEQWRSIPGAERRCRCRRLDQSGHRRQRAQFLAPGTQPGDFPDQRRHEAGLLLRPDQRKHSPERDRHVGTSDQLQHPQCVPRLVIPPRIAGHDRDAENIDLRRLQQGHHRHDVRPSRSGSVLVDDDHALLCERGRELPGRGESAGKARRDARLTAYRRSPAGPACARGSPRGSAQ